MSAALPQPHRAPPVQAGAPALPGVIDVEASGFGRGSYPIEIGFVLPDGHSVCTLVRPLPEWTHWDGEAERLHGLTRELLERHGKPPAEVALLLNHHLRGQTLYCDSWAHDYTWIAMLFDAADRRPAFRLRHLRELLNDQDAEQWDRACAEARSTLKVERHRASADARVLQLAWGRVKGVASERGDATGGHGR